MGNEKAIYDMQVGEMGFTTPWALSFWRPKSLSNKFLYAYLNTDYHVLSIPGGSVELPIRRVSKEANGFEAEFSKLRDYKFSRERAVYYGGNHAVVCLDTPYLIEDIEEFLDRERKGWLEKLLSFVKDF